jgi:hypothetical protein
MTSAVRAPQSKPATKTIGADLKGKIHLTVGTDDTFYLDGAAHSLQSTLDRLASLLSLKYLS